VGLNMLIAANDILPVNIEHRV